MSAKEKLPEEDRIRLAKLLSSVFKEEPWKAVYWLLAKNPNLGGVSACELIALNRGHKVLKFIETALSESMVVMAEGL